MAGQYLRTNYRITGGQVGVALGGAGLTAGSAIGGAGAAIGPIVIGSYSGNAAGVAGAGSNCIMIEAASALASFFGCDQGVNGYKIYPFYVRPKYRNLAATGQSGSNPIYYGSVSTSAGASQMFFWYGISAQTATSGTASAGQSFAFVYTGLVVSGP
jgi:hypothetical protein